MAVVEPRDAITFRCAAGRILESLHRCFHKGVFSSRMDQPPPGWTVLSKNRAWSGLKKLGRKYADCPSAEAVLHADVERCYASIASVPLLALLSACKCDAGALHHIGRALESWQENCGLSGLPIGVEGSGVLGTAYLMPVDEDFKSHDLGYLRFTDDFFVVGSDSDACWTYSDLIAARLDELGLRCNYDKTEVVDAATARSRWFGRNPIGSGDEVTVDGRGLTVDGALSVVVEELTGCAPPSGVTRSDPRRVCRGDVDARVARGQVIGRVSGGGRVVN
ncbi:MAG: RNA-directed DNA polymerase, partial [Actinomycetota bacterium]